MSAPIVVGSRSFVVARVPEGASVGEITVGETGTKASHGVAISASRSPTAFTRSRIRPSMRKGTFFAPSAALAGRKTPVSVFKIDLNYTLASHSSRT